MAGFIDEYSYSNSYSRHNGNDGGSGGSANSSNSKISRGGGRGNGINGSEGDGRDWTTSLIERRRSNRRGRRLESLPRPSRSSQKRKNEQNFRIEKRGKPSSIHQANWDASWIWIEHLLQPIRSSVEMFFSRIRGRRSPPTTSTSPIRRESTQHREPPRSLNQSHRRRWERARNQSEIKSREGSHLSENPDLAFTFGFSNLTKSPSPTVSPTPR